MNSIDNLSSDATQQTAVVLEDGTTVTFTLTYRGATQRWSLDVLRGTFQIFGINISTHPNLLREWRNVVPFGLGCTTTDGGDPVYQDDFSNGRAVLHILTEEDVALIEATYLGAGV